MSWKKTNILISHDEHSKNVMGKGIKCQFLMMTSVNMGRKVKLSCLITKYVTVISYAYISNKLTWTHFKTCNNSKKFRGKVDVNRQCVIIENG